MFISGVTCHLGGGAIGSQVAAIKKKNQPNFITDERTSYVPSLELV